MAPKISVIMGIYNCAGTLRPAIDSILNQTEQDFELVLCDDGSVDDTCAIAKEYQEKYPDKVVLLQNKKNLGLNITLNRCLAAAKGDYIARMDGDDLCDPTRFEKELAVLAAHPEVAFVGTQVRMFDERGVWGQTSHPQFPEKKDFAHGNPFSHGSCMVRRSAYEAMGGYSEDPQVVRVEDFYLWMRMYEAGMRGMNLPEPLYDLRDDLNAVCRRRMAARRNEAYVICQCVKHLGLPGWKRICALRPLLLGLLPRRLYRALHRFRMGA